MRRLWQSEEIKLDSTFNIADNQFNDGSIIHYIIVKTKVALLRKHQIPQRMDVTVIRKRTIREILKQGDGQAKKKTDGILTSNWIPNKEESKGEKLSHTFLTLAQFKKQWAMVSSRGWHAQTPEPMTILSGITHFNSMKGNKPEKVILMIVRKVVPNRRPVLTQLKCEVNKRSPVTW